MTLAIVNALWIGPRMGEVHAACLRSFLRLGHRVILHAYEKPRDAPGGVEFFDAGQLMAPEAIVRHKRSGSLALASDVYRYRILRAGLGLYVDCDMYCVRPIEDKPYILGWGSERHITSAILKFPAESEVVRDLCAAADDPNFIPPWDPWPKRWYHHARKLAGIPVPVQQQRWGTIGPKSVTWYVHQRGLQGHATPIDVFSPLRSKQHHKLYDPALTIDDISAPQTVAIHLRNELIRKRASESIPPNSPLGRMVAR